MHLAVPIGDNNPECAKKSQNAGRVCEGGGRGRKDCIVSCVRRHQSKNRYAFLSLFCFILFIAILRLLFLFFFLSHLDKDFVVLAAKAQGETNSLLLAWHAASTYARRVRVGEALAGASLVTGVLVPLIICSPP